MKASSKELLGMIEQHETSAVIKVGDHYPSTPSLAGLLLSYPAIYYSEDPNAKLMDTTLDLYSVCTNSPESHVIIQFSGPPPLINIITAETENIKKLWESRIEALTPSLREEWCAFVGAESYTFKIQIDNRRVPTITL
jgi:hypothetical protein